MSHTIVREHKHLLAMRWVDGKWVKTCLHHECEYQEEIKPSEVWEEEL